MATKKALLDPDQVLKETDPFQEDDLEEAVAERIRQVVEYLNTLDIAREYLDSLIVRAYRENVHSIMRLSQLTGLSRPTIYRILDENGVRRPRLR